MSIKKRYTGYTEGTMERRVTGAGAYFKNYDITTDTFTTAVTANKLIGATKGGGEFKAIPSIRQVEVDGVPGKVKGMEEIDSWDVTMTANVIEVTADTLAMALAASDITKVEGKNYKCIKGKNTIDVSDYDDNITFLGTVTGFNDPIIIQVYNTLSVAGLTFGTKDKDDTVIPMNFTGHYDASALDEPPFAIFVPVASIVEE